MVAPHLARSLREGVWGRHAPEKFRGFRVLKLAEFVWGAGAGGVYHSAWPLIQFLGVTACSTPADANFSVFGFYAGVFKLIFEFYALNLPREQPHTPGACLKHLTSAPLHPTCRTQQTAGLNILNNTPTAALNLALGSN